MGCNSDYLNQNSKERELQRAARILVFLYDKLNMPVSKELQEAADTYYCRTDFVPELCKVVSSLRAVKKFRFPTEKLFNSLNDDEKDIVLELGLWAWEHEKADRERLEKEEKESRMAQIRSKVTKRMSAEEKEAMGLK